MAFEDIIGYIIVLGAFTLVFLPLLAPLISTFVTQSTDPKVTLLWTLVQPVIFILIIYAFYKRLMGEKPYGENNPF